MNEAARTIRRKKKESKSGIKLRVHPLFLLLGAYYCFTGELASFFLSAVVALQHECAHAFAAAKRGYVLNRVVLMPYGAVIDGDFSDASFFDEVAVALCGPIANLLTAIGFVALWWLFPAAYPYTDGAFYASLSVALVNLLPAYPLDGGRILCACLRRRAGEKRAKRIGRAITFVFAAAFFALFAALLLRGAFDLSLGIFALFLFVGGLGNGKDSFSAYEKIRYSFRESLRRGAEVKRVAILSSCTLRHALAYTEKGRYLVLDVYNEREEKIGEVGQNALASFFERGSLTDEIGSFLRKSP